MNNQEKAIEIANEFADKNVRPAIRVAAEEMAEWKDQQFKEAVAQLRKWLYEHGKLEKLDLVEFDMEINKLFNADNKVK